MSAWGARILGIRAMPLKENEILDQVEAYLVGHVSLRDLSAWLHEAAWDMDEAVPRAQAFAYAVLGRLAERSTSGSPEVELRRELQSLARDRRERLDRLSRGIGQESASRA